MKQEKYNKKMDKLTSTRKSRAVGKPNSKQRTRYISSCKKELQRIARNYRKSKFNDLSFSL